MTETVLVAVIAAFGVIAAGLPAALIERARRENATDHAFVRRTLEAIDDHLNEIEDSLDEATEALIQHIDDEEAHRGDSGSTSGD